MSKATDILNQISEIKPQDVKPPNDEWKDYKVGDFITVVGRGREAVAFGNNIAKIKKIIMSKGNQFRAFSVVWNSGRQEDISYPDVNMMNHAPMTAIKTFKKDFK